ncbi:ferrous iron transport protein B [Telmatocola sphagniphila]|uniref:Ferrous iron transport protein B n=1 Tax=Telmatocola sphagniphila TaxID=1123043 RepID=A0A8E6B870_9BACT|nr:ferrous iron transport protein B [Telmatocola sphagniphila]QVL33054.1 ferrous iron transport protein B [Telmatocola sphagniphila]
MTGTKKIRVALLGNPNTGKTTLFNALTGLKQHVGNYPGITIEIKTGISRFEDVEFEVIDLPGTYSLAARSPDELIALELLLGLRPGEAPPDAIISIVDATNLERHLYLAGQLFDLQIPMVMAVNFIDEAKAKGIEIEFEHLSERLGIAVIPIQANKGINLDRLKSALYSAVLDKRIPDKLPAPEEFEQAKKKLHVLLPTAPPVLVRRLLIDVGGYLEKTYLPRTNLEFREELAASRDRLATFGHALPTADVRRRFDQIRHILKGIITRPDVHVRQFRDRLDAIFTHKVWGTLVFFLAMFCLFQSIFSWAEPAKSVIEFGQDWLTRQVESAMSAGPLRSLLSEGIIKGVGSVLVFLPQILVLFVFISVMEDCGYLARAAFLMDKLMSGCGLHGRSFIPLLSSLACAVPGIMSTRVIENHRDRLTTILVAPLMSCSARLPLYVLIIGTFLSDPWWLPGLTLFGVYLLGFIAAPLFALLFKRTILRGPRPLFVMEMPPLRRPTLRNVFRRVYDAGRAFVMRAGTVILAAMILVWASLYFPNKDLNGVPYEDHLELISEKIDHAKEQGAEGEATVEKLEEEKNQLFYNWRKESYLGRVGQWMEPVFRPLGWDWKIGVAALASFPAREVVVGTLGILYKQGEVETKDQQISEVGETPLAKAIRSDWSEEPSRNKYRIATAVSLIVFFAFCCQCVSTLAVIRRETQSLLWPTFTFVYMTALAYLASMATFQIGRLIIDRSV